MKEITQDAGVAALKVAPAAVVVAADKLGGLNWNDLVLIATLGYIVLQAAWLLVRGYWQWQDRRSGKRE